MTSYGAVLSLKNTIDYLLHSSHITLVDDPSLQIIQQAYNELQPLQQILERLDSTSKSRSRKKVNELDGRIKDKIWELEDKLESLLYQQILLQFPAAEQGMEELLFSIDLNFLQDDVASFIQAIKNMEKEYIYEIENMDEDDEEESTSSTTGFDGTNSKMIGLSDQLEHLKEDLTLRDRGVHIYLLTGMAGVGKTTLASQFFQDPEISNHYDYRVWVGVGRKPQLSWPFLAQIGERLKGKRCLVVVDDVWEKQVLVSLVNSLPNIGNGIVRILVTARERNVDDDPALLAVGEVHLPVVVRFLNEEESKELLCEKVFGGKELCPIELDKAATKIAKKCEGLPLMIVTVADILSKSQNTEPEYWNEVAEERNSVFTDAYNEISKVLFPSYDYLPQYLKMPFLFMGVFHPDYDNPPSKIINMLAAEGWFLDTYKTKSFEVCVWQCLDELCMDKNLLLFNRTSIYRHGKYKTCRLHSSWRHVCRGEARKNKFYHAFHKLVDGSEEGVIEGQRGLCLQNNILFGFKEFRDSVRSNCAALARSLLFFGPYHQYPTPIDVGFRLLRELDALQLRFYTFPTEILTLVLLKYLALTFNGELPTTISKLFNLRVLIIHPHMNIRRCRAPSYIPIQIWDMKELESIEISGKNLVAPHRVASLQKLLTLVGVNANISTISDISRRIPNIRKLVVQIEHTPYDDHNDLLSCFGCISSLESLETLKCSIMNPVAKTWYAIPANPSSLMLPRGLKKLHLSGTGFPWEYMDVIGTLPYLEVLKLRSYAFQGPTWEAQEGSFSTLEFLLIEDTDLVYLNLSSGNFRLLTLLNMKHCYKLERIEWPSGLFDIELVDCNPLALNCATQLHQSQPRDLRVTAFLSYHQKPMTINLERYYDSEDELIGDWEEDDNDEDLVDWEEDDEEEY